MNDGETAKIVRQRKEMLDVAKRAFFQGRVSHDTLRWAAEQYSDAIRAHAKATGKKVRAPHPAKLMR